jgi:hypothetical protein
VIIDSKYDIGDTLKDVVTGYQGVVMVIARYATGCIHYGLALTELKKDNSIGEWEWLDGSRLKLVNKKKVIFDVGIDTSGPEQNPPQI